MFPGVFVTLRFKPTSCKRDALYPLGDCRPAFMQEHKRRLGQYPPCLKSGLQNGGDGISGVKKIFWKILKKGIAFSEKSSIINLAFRRSGIV